MPASSPPADVIPIQTIISINILLLNTYAQPLPRASSISHSCTPPLQPHTPNVIVLHNKMEAKMNIIYVLLTNLASLCC